jgi:hypothetical protein
MGHRPPSKLTTIFAKMKTQLQNKPCNTIHAITLRNSLIPDSLMVHASDMLAAPILAIFILQPRRCSLLDMKDSNICTEFDLPTDRRLTSASRQFLRPEALSTFDISYICQYIFHGQYTETLKVLRTPRPRKHTSLSEHQFSSPPVRFFSGF